MRKEERKEISSKSVRFPPIRVHRQPLLEGILIIARKEKIHNELKRPSILFISILIKIYRIYLIHARIEEFYTTVFSRERFPHFFASLLSSFARESLSYMYHTCKQVESATEYTV